MGLKNPGRAASLAFLTAFVTLFVQILVHRMVAAKLVNNFAFLVISLTMLGFALSGVVLSRGQERLIAKRDELVALSTALFAITLIGASAAFYHAPSGEQWAASRAGFVFAFLRRLPLAFLYAVPFTFCGIVLGALLSSPDLPTRRIYFMDLLGSAAGAFAVIPAITRLGVETSALVACAVMLAGGVGLAVPRRRSSRLLAAAAALTIALAAIFSHEVFGMRYPARSILSAAQQPGSGVFLERVAWDPLARIELSRIPPPDPELIAWPSLVGESRDFLQRFKRILTQNNTAFTYAVEYDGKQESLRGIEETLYAAAYQARSVPTPRVLVIGVGGGFDVLNALYFDAASVTGVEVNGAVIDILTRSHRSYFRPWLEDGRVRLLHEEGRHFLARTPETFDIIQLSGVDSASGTPAAAHVFSETYLYTAEAFDLFLSHLEEGGIVCMMRAEYVPPREMLRALVTAVGALRRGGVERPRDHVVVLAAKDGLFTSLLVKKTPFSSAEVGRLQRWAATSRLFGMAAAPGLEPATANVYQAFLSLGDPRREAAFVNLYPFDIRPVADNRPFFFKYSNWADLFSSDPVVRKSIPVLEIGLLLLLGSASLAAVLCIYVPLHQLAAGGTPTPGAGRYGLFFAGLGLGYMSVEMALLQKFGLLLGHPNYALSVVLAALLLASGFGSLFSAQTVSRLGELRFVGYVFAAVVLSEYLLVFPRLPRLIAQPFWLRALMVFALVTPIGLCLGTFFPSAVERLKGEAAPFIPWAWGINGIFSVVAPILGVGLSTTWGIDALLLAAIPIYLLAGFALPGAPKAGA